jgi:tyrosinase
MLSRRTFLGGISLGTFALGEFDRFGSHRGVASADTAPTVVRRSVGSMGENDPDLAAYRTAVTDMLALPGSDFRNWISQADIHRNHCPHGNWYFLPWHRAYLSAFERICRSLSGKADFALPYWDWTVDRQLPSAFTRGDESNNVLNHTRPGFGPSDSLPDDMVGPDVINRILNNSIDFESFGSTRPRGQDSAEQKWQRRAGSKTELEFNPHDGVHGTLLGDMGAVTLSPRDPIFWMHHCNIDRIWSNWIERGHSNSNDPLWDGFRFDGQFYNLDGSMWKIGVHDTLSTSPLGYSYRANVPTIGVNTHLQMNLEAFHALSPDLFSHIASGLIKVQLSTGSGIEIASASNEASASVAQPLSMPVALGRSLTEAIRPAPLPSSASGEPVLAEAEQRVVARIIGLQAPKDPTTRVRIFVNCDYLSPKTPTSDPHYVTSFSFFNSEHMHDEGQVETTINVDLTASLSRVARTVGLQGNELIVQLMPVAAKAFTEETEVRPVRVEIAII